MHPIKVYCRLYIYVQYEKEPQEALIFHKLPYSKEIVGNIPDMYQTRETKYKILAPYEGVPK